MEPPDEDNAETQRFGAVNRGGGRIRDMGRGRRARCEAVSMGSRRRL